MIKYLRVQNLLAAVVFLFGIHAMGQVQLKEQTDFMTPIMGINSSGQGVSLNGYYDFETNTISPTEGIVLGTEAITDSGLILGMIEGPSGDFQPAVRVDGVWTGLPSSTGLTGDDALYSISENGTWIVGQKAWDPDTDTAWGFIYNTQTEEFRLMESPLYEYSAAYGVNNEGYAVGWVDDLDYGTHRMPAVFAPNGDIILVSEDYGELSGINESGVVVGNLEGEGVIYDISTESTQTLPFDSGMFTDISLTSISENGVIVGFGTMPGFARMPILYHPSLGSDFVTLNDFLADFGIDTSEFGGTAYKISRNGNYIAGFTDGPAFMAMGWAVYLDDFFPGEEESGDCGQGNESNEFESMAVISLGAASRAADDFFVTEGTINISQIEINIMSVVPFTSMDMFFYHDGGGEPGDRILHYDQMEIPVEPTQIGQVGAFGIYKTFVDLDLDFENGHYWFAPVVDSPVAGWEATSEGTLGEYMVVSGDYGETWSPMEVDGDFFQGVFTIHCGETGGGSNEDCDQGDVSNPAGVDNGFGITLGDVFDVADDFFVSEGNTLDIKMIKLNLLAVDLINQVDIVFYEDDGSGFPGTLMTQSVSTAITPEQQVLVGTAFGFNQYEVYIPVDLSFTEGHYWMSPHASYVGSGSSVYWEQTYVGTLGEPASVRNLDLGEEWEVNSDGSQSVFTLYCEEVDVPEEPDLPCNFEIEFDVEPITRVLFAGIDNVTDATLNGSPALEDFTDIEGNVEAGATYEVALEGNTNGTWTNYFTVFIKWNEDSSWTDYSTYEIGSLAGSTGTDGQQVTGNISIPADAAEGAYTMRVIKSFGASPTDPCGTYGWGQAEDYTLIVGEGDGGGGDECWQGIPSVATVPNAYGITIGTQFRVAEDFTVPEGTTFTVEQLTFDINNIEVPDFAIINLRADNGGEPGEVLYTIEMEPSSWEEVGTAFGEPIYNMVFDLADPIEFGEGLYWIDPKMSVPSGDTVWWASTDEDSDGALPMASGDDGATWGSSIDTHMVFTISGHCATLGLGDVSTVDFSYFPNPVNDMLNIHTAKNIQSLSVFNMAGQQMMSQKAINNGQINVSALPQGVYVFRVVLEGGQVETFKIIKK